MFTEINFSPFANNVLDFVGRNDLTTPNGCKVKIFHSMAGFSIHFESENHSVSFAEMDNLQASNVLNRNQVGIRQTAGK